MAFSGVSGSLLCLTMAVFVVMLTTPASSLTCTSQKFTNNKLYQNCTDLPSLTSYLHWTYNSTNSSLSIAFVAAPANSSGWIAWAINPTGTGMVGAQALVAFVESDVPVVKTYNISSYGPIVESKLSFDVWDTSAESSDGVMRIFAQMAVVPSKNGSVNQVWQVGSVVKDGVPVKHAFAKENLSAKASLNLTSVQQNTTTTPAGGDSWAEKKNVGFLYLVSFLMLWSFMIFSF